MAGEEGEGTRTHRVVVIHEGECPAWIRDGWADRTPAGLRTPRHREAQS
jgi:hypothetical protein